MTLSLELSARTRARQEYLKRLLVPFWLRPESALWYAHEAALAKEFLGDAPWGPSLEIGSMEGIASLVMMGGEFDPTFDVYSEVAWDRDSVQWKSLAQDYYNRIDAEKTSTVVVKTMPSVQFDLGLVWKDSHQVKASRLGVYRKILQADPNKALTSLKNNEFKTIWGPNLYWIDELEVLLDEVERILMPGGRLVTVLPDTCALEHMLYRLKETSNSEWIKDLDRGRHENISRQARTLDEWKGLFSQCGLTVSKHERFIPKPVFQVNDIGLRPLFPVLMDIYDTLRQKTPQDFLRIKEHWIQTVLHFLLPLCDTDWMDRMGTPNVWHIFELRKP